MRRPSPSSSASPAGSSAFAAFTASASLGAALSAMPLLPSPSLAPPSLSPALLKIDVEGLEGRVLQGSLAALSAAQVWLIALEYGENWYRRRFKL